MAPPDEEVAVESPLRQIAGGGIAFVLTGLVQRGLSFLILPFVLRYLGPSQYGEVALIYAIAGVVGVVLSFGLETAIFRRLYQLEDDQISRTRFLVTVRRFLLIGPTVGVAVLTLPAFAVASIWDTLSFVPLEIALIGAAIGNAALVLPHAVLRAEERFGAYSKLNLTASFAQAAGIVIGVVVIDGGVLGWVLGTTIASVVTFFVGHAMADLPRSGPSSRVELRRALVFGLPLLPHALAHWGLTMSDRVVLGAYVGTREIGVYALAYQLGAVVGMVLTEANRAVMGAYGHVVRGTRKPSALADLLTFQVSMTLAVGGGMAALGPPVLELVFPTEYEAGTALVPWVALGYVFLGLYYVPMNVVSMIHGTTRRVWVATVIAAAVNLGLNLLFIPEYGIAAAAITTTLGYLVLLVAVYIYARRVSRTRMPLNVGRSVRHAMLTALTVTAAFALPTSTPVSTLLTRSGALAILLVLLLVDSPNIPNLTTLVRSSRNRKGSRR